MSKPTEQIVNPAPPPESTTPQICGVVMPISAIDSLLEEHWNDVRAIIFDAIRESGFTPNMVSDANEVSVIHARIVQNLYDNPIVVCDVSCKNPNVMFELGMRLAFNKPTIVITDDKTTYSFDTGPIEHLVYPRDLRFAKIRDFKALLADKIRATCEASRGPSYKTFLEHFARTSVAKLETQEISKSDYIIKELQALRKNYDTSNRLIGGLVAGVIGYDPEASSLTKQCSLANERFSNKVCLTKDEKSGPRRYLLADSETAARLLFPRMIQNINEQDSFTSTQVEPPKLVPDTQ